MKNTFNIKLLSILLIVILAFSFVSCNGTENETPPPTTPTESVSDTESQTVSEEQSEIQTQPEIPATNGIITDASLIPEYASEDVIELNGGIPTFTPAQTVTESYEHYSTLDSLGRCGVAVACLGRDLMPTDSRGSVSSVTPTGWFVVGSGTGAMRIYERSHLLGWQLTGENANRQNLISGTFTLNGNMQAFEDMIASYIKETGNHVMYRVTPIFEGNNLLCSGVVMEGYSVEDNGEGICFNVFLYNVQKDYVINYATGEFSLDENSEALNYAYVINKSNKKFHKAECSNVASMKESNKEYSNKTSEELKEEGYISAGCCKP